MSRPALHLAVALLVVAAGVAGVGVTPAGAVSDGIISITTSVSPQTPVAGEEFTVDTTIQRAADGEGEFYVEYVGVSNSTDPADEFIERDRYREAAVDAGDSITRSLELERERPGTHQLYLHLEIRGGVTTPTHIVKPLDLRVYGAHPGTSLDAETAVVGAYRSLNLTVSNGRETPIRDVTVSLDSDEIQVRQTRRVTPVLGSGNATTFRFRALATEAGRSPVDVRLRYTGANGTRHVVDRTLSADFVPPTNPGRVNLTGVSIESRGETLDVSGSASNPGGDRVTGVVVEAVDADGVAPAQPQPDYFVGEVPASDFETFDVNARLSGDRESIPLRVVYVVDGVKRTRIVSVPYDGDSRQPAPATANRSAPSRTSPSGSLPGPLSVPILGVGAAVIALVAGAYVWRRR
jgi:hypothetical protein